MIKNIYIVWFQGFDNAPDLVKRCVNSWKYYNPDWTVVLIDNANLSNYVNLENYINDIYNKSIEKCHVSDIVRSILLKLYGGLWVDATTFCNKSLTDWLPNYIKEGFFAFDKPGPDRLISNWFLYSDTNGYIINKWCNNTLLYYSLHNKAETYYIHHYIFGDLYESDIEFKKIWDKVPKLSATGTGPHYILEKGMCNNITNEIQTDIDAKITPLYKLTYKYNLKEYNENTILYYLYKTIQ